MDKEKEILRIANNVILFGDNSDFGSVLWEILIILDPDKYETSGEMPELKYISKEK